VAATGQIPWPPVGSFHDRHWAVPTGHWQLAGPCSPSMN